MVLIRFAFALALSLGVLACGSDNSSPTNPSSTPEPTPGGSSSTVTIPMGAEALGNRAFTPGNLDVAVGTTVTWMNTDAVGHTSTSNASGWDSGIIQPGRQFSFTYQTAGSFPYHCAIHPGMVGTVTVR